MDYRDREKLNQWELRMLILVTIEREFTDGSCFGLDSLLSRCHLAIVSKEGVDINWSSTLKGLFGSLHRVLHRVCTFSRR